MHLLWILLLGPTLALSSQNCTKYGGMSRAMASQRGHPLKHIGWFPLLLLLLLLVSAVPLQAVASACCPRCKCSPETSPFTEYVKRDATNPF